MENCSSGGLNWSQQESRVCCWGQDCVLLPLAGRDGWHRNKLVPVTQNKQMRRSWRLQASGCLCVMGCKSRSGISASHKILALWCTYLCSWNVKGLCASQRVCNQTVLHLSVGRTEVYWPPWSKAFWSYCNGTDILCKMLWIHAWRHFTPGCLNPEGNRALGKTQQKRCRKEAFQKATRTSLEL